MDLPPRTLSSSTASFARDNIALDLASQELDFGTKWTQRLLRTPSPQGLSQPPPLFHGSKNRAMRTSPIPFKGFSDSDSDSDANETDNTGTPNIPSTPLVRTTRASGPIKNFYVLIDTLPPMRTTTLPSVPKPPHTPPPQTQSIHQGHVDDEWDAPMDIFTSPSRSPILVRRLQPLMHHVPVSGIILSLDGHQPETLPLKPQYLPGPMTSHYQGTPNNSCWLDSGEWEALYAISLHDRAFWKWEYDTTPLTYPLEHHIGDLRWCLAARDVVHSYASQKEAPQLLCDIHDGYHLHLLMPKQSAPIDSLGEQESPFVSAHQVNRPNPADSVYSS